MDGLSDGMSAAHALKDRAYLVLNALVRSSYFGEKIPDEKTLVQTTRLPKLAISEALQRLQKEGVLEQDGDRFRRIYSPKNSEGRIAFFVNSNLFASWYGIFQDYLIGFQEVLQKANYEVIFRGEFDRLDHKLEAIKRYYENGIRAIGFASYAEPKVRQLVLERMIPSVVLGNATIHQQDLGTVCSNNRDGMDQIVGFLMSKGHAHIAYYTSGIGSHDGFQERYQGYEFGMRKRGLRPVHDLVFQEKHSSAMARQACLAFASLNPRPTAIACSTDREAFELISELGKSGIKVPQDVSVTGFDNNIFGSIMRPALTTIEIRARDIGRVGANYLLNEMVQAQVPIRMLLPTELIERESVAPCHGSLCQDPALAKKTTRIVLPEDELMSF